MLVSKRRQCGLPPAGGGVARSARALACELLVPTKSVSWSENVLFKQTCVSLSLKQRHSASMYHHKSRTVWDIFAKAVIFFLLPGTVLESCYGRLVCTFMTSETHSRLMLLKNKVLGRFQDGGWGDEGWGVKSNDPLRPNYQTHRAFLEIPFCLGLGPPLFRLLYQLIIVF